MDDGGSAGNGDQQSLTTTYEDIRDLSTIDQGAWYDATASLNTQFSAACGGEFCSAGQTFVPLTFGCTATTKAGDVHACAWTFTMGQVEVDPKTAAIDVNLPTYVCPITVKSQTAASYLKFLQGTDSLHATQTGGPASIDDQLSGCFEYPIGATPITLNSGSTYVSATNYYTTAANKTKWTASQTALLDGFNNVCGDTFCSSDYNDLQSLQFECSVTKSSGKLKSCAWVFAGSFYTANTSTGKVNETTKSFDCPVAVNGTISQLITTLTASGTTDPIQRTLPGETTSAYDAIAGCLP